MESELPQYPPGFNPNQPEQSYIAEISRHCLFLYPDLMGVVVISDTTGQAVFVVDSRPMTDSPHLLSEPAPVYGSRHAYTPPPSPPPPALPPPPPRLSLLSLLNPTPPAAVIPPFSQAPSPPIILPLPVISNNSPSHRQLSQGATTSPTPAVAPTRPPPPLSITLSPRLPPTWITYTPLQPVEIDSTRCRSHSLTSPVGIPQYLNLAGNVHHILLHHALPAPATPGRLLKDLWHISAALMDRKLQAMRQYADAAPGGRACACPAGAHRDVEFDQRQLELLQRRFGEHGGFELAVAMAPGGYGGDGRVKIEMMKMEVEKREEAERMERERTEERERARGWLSVVVG